VKEKRHAKCRYCGAIEGTEWTTSSINFRTYCSRDCKRAGELSNFLCALVIVVVIVISLWSGFGTMLSNVVLGIFLVLFTAILCIPTLIPVYLGIKARNRISEKSD
jgi:hypothetical protein